MGGGEAGTVGKTTLFFAVKVLDFFSGVGHVPHPSPLVKLLSILSAILSGCKTMHLILFKNLSCGQKIVIVQNLDIFGFSLFNLFTKKLWPLFGPFKK